MGISKIEWTERTWNPITGCTKISEGCQHCYAERMSKRLAGRCGYDKDGPFKVVKHDNVFVQPLKWKKPQKIFVCSMGDLFHDDVEERWIDAVFAAMALAEQHTYMILTKRPERMRDYINSVIELGWEGIRKRFYHLAMGLCDIREQNCYMHHMNASMEVSNWFRKCMPNLWLGVTAENQQRADERIPILLQIPAAVRFVSIEPMLGPVDLQQYLEKGWWPTDWEHDNMGSYTYWREALAWVICGGETGPGARPMHPDWVKSLRDQCQATGVPFFFKSWGDWIAFYDRDKDDPDWEALPKEHSSICQMNIKGGRGFHGDRLIYFKRVGKKSSGRLLDGQEWNQYPVG